MSSFRSLYSELDIESEEDEETIIRKRREMRKAIEQKYNYVSVQIKVTNNLLVCTLV